MLHYYHKMPEKTVEDFRNFWFHTGDAGRMDKDGYIYFVDRVKDYIRRRGENISSFEVEKIVNSHPDVEESAAIGIKSEAGKYAEDELMILVIPKEGKKIDPEELMDYLQPQDALLHDPEVHKVRRFLPQNGHAENPKKQASRTGSH